MCGQVTCVESPLHADYGMNDVGQDIVVGPLAGLPEFIYV